MSATDAHVVAGVEFQSRLTDSYWWGNAVAGDTPIFANVPDGATVVGVLQNVDALETVQAAITLGAGAAEHIAYGVSTADAGTAGVGLVCRATS